MSARRKSESSEGDDRPRKRQHRAQGSLACPFYKRDPTHHMHCLYRNQLTSTSFVRQHILRYHSRCPNCGDDLEDAVDRRHHPHQHTQKPRRSRDFDLTRGPGGSKDGREGLCRCQFRDPCESRSPQRTRTETERWYDIYNTIFPREPQPRSPYIDSPENEILRMTLEAIRKISPRSSLLQLESLDSWSAVSSVLEEKAIPDSWLDQTPSEAGSLSSCGPPTPSDPVLQVVVDPSLLSLSTVTTHGVVPNVLAFNDSSANSESRSDLYDDWEEFAFAGPTEGLDPGWDELTSNGLYHIPTQLKVGGNQGSWCTQTSQ